MKEYDIKGGNCTGVKFFFLFSMFCYIRRVARNFWVQRNFRQIRAQILNSSERLSYMQTLQRVSFKNNYLYQIQIQTFTDIQARTYTFMVKRINKGFNIFTKENERCYVSLPIPYIRPSLFRGCKRGANWI